LQQNSIVLEQPQLSPVSCRTESCGTAFVRIVGTIGYSRQQNSQPANIEMLESELAKQSDVQYIRQKTIQSNPYSAPSYHNPSRSLKKANSPRVSL